MTTPRFLLLRWTPADHEMGRQAAQAIAARTADGAWREVLAWRGVSMIVCARTCGDDLQVLPQKTGVILGALFERGDAAPRRAPPIASREAFALAEEGGASLLEKRWGDYLAVLVDHARDMVHVLREPMGAQACHYARWARAHVACSHPEDLVALGWRAAVDHDHVAGFLARPDLSTRATGLAGLSALYPGERVSFAREGIAHAQMWRPRQPARGAPFADAADAARETACACAGAWASTASRILHRLSGGLDSSAVLGCLRASASDREIVAAIEFTPAAAEADERRWARLAAARAGCRLVEIEMRPEAVDYARVLEAPLAAGPSLSLLSFGDAAYRAHLEAIGADMITSGQGGDHVFQRARPPWLGADAVRDGVRGRALMEIAHDVAALSGHSLWRVGWAMLVEGVLRRPWDVRGEMARRNPFQTEAPTRALDDFAAHPWLSGLDAVSPARAQRVFHLLDAVRYHDPSLLNARRRCAPVLLSQPLVELCLSVAPYRMVEGGKERALARAAFAPVTPPEIIARTIKGETTRYFNAVLARQLPFLRELLLSGSLQEARVIDRARLEAALTPGGLADGAVAHGVLCCAAAELWGATVTRAVARAGA